MLNKMASTKFVDDNLDCALLSEFRDFLKEFTSNIHDSLTEVKNTNIISRQNSETYPVSMDELHAEILSCIWTHLQAKQCPQYFQLNLLHEMEHKILQEFRNNKDDRFNCTTTNKIQNSLEAYYDLAKLKKIVINNLEKLLARLTDNSARDHIKNYAEMGTLCQGCCGKKCVQLTALPFVVGCIKNKPRKMEDRFICLNRYSAMYHLNQSYSLYGVFDGHSGSLAANYTTSHLPYILAEYLNRVDDTNSSSSHVYQKAFESAFLLTDKMFSKKCIAGGTTAVCALISHRMLTDHLYVAWVGDSKALLVSPDLNVQLVKPHKPDMPEERKRIEASENGGSCLFVQGHWRVNGILNVSRSIGDYSLSAVVAKPDFIDVEIETFHDFLVLGTDGLWDYVNEATLVNTIYLALAEAEKDPKDIPKLLIELAKQGDSTDNVTVMVIFLKEPSKIVENYKASIIL